MGPTAVKLCQWAAGRPDLFPAAATKRFSRLHDAVRPHAFHHTDRALAAALGADWRDTLELDERRLLGSGCIAQVYEGTQDGQRVAVKVVHPGVREAVETDMELLAFCVGCGERFAPGAFRYLAVGGSVHRFGAIMRSQLDLRTEASNLERLHAHFVRDDSVVVPRPVGRRRSPDVLVEEFVAGVPVLDFARGDEARAAKIAEAGARAVLKMVLHHNFVHGDLHPGNMLVNDRAQLVLLDAGICVEIGDRAHEDMVSILKAMLERRAAPTRGASSWARTRTAAISAR
ncbi:kinase [Aureococcus anophagefferens]|nr:kinase [Aureococcus anophagefferens]